MDKKIVDTRYMETETKTVSYGDGSSTQYLVCNRVCYCPIPQGARIETIRSIASAITRAEESRDIRLFVLEESPVRRDGEAIKLNPLFRLQEDGGQERLVPVEASQL